MRSARPTQLFTLYALFTERMTRIIWGRLVKIISEAKRFMANEIVRKLEKGSKTELLSKLEVGVKAKEVKIESKINVFFIITGFLLFIGFIVLP